MTERAYKRCSVCGGPFRPTRSTQIYCSAHCRLERSWRTLAMRRRQERDRCTKCARKACAKVFWTRHSRRVFCSAHCRWLAAQRVAYQCRKFEAELAAKMERRV